MFNLAQARQAIDRVLNTTPSGIALTWNTSVQFDASLVEQLVAQHDRLQARFTSLVAHLENHPKAAERVVRDCADQLHKLRHAEAIQVYPVIAHALSQDPVARRLFWQSRLVMLGLARRVLRRFEELVRAIQSRTEIPAAADHVVKAFAEYRHRNETQMYPLYNFVGKRSAVPKPRSPAPAHNAPDHPAHARETAGERAQKVSRVHVDNGPRESPSAPAETVSRPRRVQSRYMVPVLRRAISSDELALIWGALHRAPTAHAPATTPALPAHVIGQCRCGCGSIEFESPANSVCRQLADGAAFLASGERVAVIVWGNEERIARLEIVDHGWSSGRLPLPESVCSWDKANARAAQRLGLEQVDMEWRD